VEEEADIRGLQVSKTLLKLLQLQTEIQMLPHGVAITELHKADGVEGHLIIQPVKFLWVAAVAPEIRIILMVVPEEMVAVWFIW
jgi:hypothetical protein